MGHVSSKTRSPGQILENYFLNITSDLDPQVSPVVYKAIKKGNSLKSSLSGERSRALWALLLYLFMIIDMSMVGGGTSKTRVRPGPGPGF